MRGRGKIEKIFLFRHKTGRDKNEECFFFVSFGGVVSSWGRLCVKEYINSLG